MDKNKKYTFHSREILRLQTVLGVYSELDLTFSVASFCVEILRALFRAIACIQAIQFDLAEWIPNQNHKLA